MWQTIVTVILLIGAATYMIRHFLRIYRTGNDCTCSGCSSSGCCGGKPIEADQMCTGEHSSFLRTDEGDRSQ